MWHCSKDYILNYISPLLIQNYLNYFWLLTLPNKLRKRMFKFYERFYCIFTETTLNLLVSIDWGKQASCWFVSYQPWKYLLTYSCVPFVSFNDKHQKAEWLIIALRRSCVLLNSFLDKKAKSATVERIQVCTTPNLSCVKRRTKKSTKRPTWEEQRAVSHSFLAVS